MNKEILMVVDAISNEKDVDREIIFQAIEAALASATRKKYPGDIEVRVDIDPQDGSYVTFRRWEVLPEFDEEGHPTELEYPSRQVSLDAARAMEEDDSIEPGDYLEEEIESVEFGRIAAQTAKQVIVQKVREAERNKVVALYRDKIGELISGIVKRTTRSAVIIDLGGNAEADIPKSELISREMLRIGDRVRALLYEIKEGPRGPILQASRSSSAFLIELFKIEVPEIGEGLIKLHGASRDPGSRAKIAVEAVDGRIDPVGACVGMRGSRVQAVSNELSGERVDIILWNENPAQFVINAMAPADVISIVVDEETRTMDIAVSEENLSQAIGRGGQNIRLASQLTGWELNVMDEEEAALKNLEEAKKYIDAFMRDLRVDAEVAETLVSEGFTTLDEIAYVDANELLTIEGFDEAIVNELRGRASDTLLTKAITSEQEDPYEALLAMDGMDKETAEKLKALDVSDMEGLAELSVEELMEVEGMTPERAGELIMTARAPWFAEAEAEAKGNNQI